MVTKYRKKQHCKKINAQQTREQNKKDGTAGIFETERLYMSGQNIECRQTKRSENVTQSLLSHVCTQIWNTVRKTVCFQKSKKENA